MEEFKVKLSKVRQTVQEQNNIAKQMKRLEDEVRSVYNGLSFEVAQKEQIRRRLRRAGDSISAQYGSLHQATRALGNIANTYERADLKLVGAKPKKGAIPSLTAAEAVLGLMIGPGAAAVATNPEIREVIVGPIKKVFGDEADEKFNLIDIEPKYKGKDGKLKDIEWSEDPEDKSLWSHNKKGLEDSKINPFMKIADYKKEWDKSLFSDENLFGDEDGSHIETTFDVVKREGSVEIYDGLYTEDTKTGEKTLQMAIGAEVGASVTALSMSEKMQLGNKNLGAYLKSEQTLGKVSVGGDAIAGVFDAEGDVNPTVHASAKAEAIAAEIAAKGGVNVLGADVGVRGAVNFGVGLHAELGLKDGVISADAGVALGLGVSAKLEVDISGTVDAVADGAKAVWDGMTEMLA